jgi:hypothetical protein
VPRCSKDFDLPDQLSRKPRHTYNKHSSEYQTFKIGSFLPPPPPSGALLVDMPVDSNFQRPDVDYEGRGERLNDGAVARQVEELGVIMEEMNAVPIGKRVGCALSPGPPENNYRNR